MLFTRNQINKAGDTLLGTDPFAYQQAVQMVMSWRETFLPILRDISSQIEDLFHSHNIPIAFYSQRIKRMTSIEEKLRNNVSQGMKLGGLQDIGGTRFVFTDINILDRAKEVLTTFVPQDFELKNVMDYITIPKESGYRGIHYIYKYHSDNPIYDGLQIELQVRTLLQHRWAMAVETASLLSHTSLKAQLNTELGWREFFKLVSAIFARQEGKPVYTTFTNYTHEKYCMDYLRHIRSGHYLDQLRALQTTINDENLFTRTQKGVCILSIDFEHRHVYWKVFTIDEQREATRLFNEIEKTINKDCAVVMVSIEKMNEIKEAYPSFFLDTEDFLKSLEAFNRSCEM